LFLNIFAEISSPPVDPPLINNIAIEIPETTPQKIEAVSLSFVGRMEKLGKKVLMESIKIEDTNTIMPLFRANFFPKSLNPKIKSGMFKIIEVRPILKLKSLLRERAIPSMPPVPILEGVSNNAAYTEYNIVPARSSKNCLDFVFII
jgi:hypothetical protein